MTIYLGNIPYDSTEAELYELLSGYGSVFDLNYPRDAVTGNYRGFAFVTISDREGAEKALRSLDGSQFGGRTLRASKAKAPDRPANQGLPVGFRPMGSNPFQGGGHRRR